MVKLFNLPIPEKLAKSVFDSNKELRPAVRRGDSYAVMNFLRKYKNPVVPDLADVQPWLFYDRLKTAAGASPGNLLFFTTPLSSTKSKLDTNLKQAGRLPDPKHFLAMAMRFVVSPDIAPADLDLILKSYYIEFEIGDKIYAEGHLDLYPGGAGVSGLAAVSVAGTNSTNIVQLGTMQLNNGEANPNAVNSWGTDHGIHILQGQTFQVRALAPTAVTLAAAATTNNTPQGIGATTITAGTAGASGTGTFGGIGADIRAILDGILYREVQ